MALVVLCVHRRKQLCGEHGEQQMERLEAGKLKAR
jgi:hypothetical protein